jgi:hypothetical protein
MPSNPRSGVVAGERSSAMGSSSLPLVPSSPSRRGNVRNTLCGTRQRFLDQFKTEPHRRMWRGDVDDVETAVQCVRGCRRRHLTGAVSTRESRFRVIFRVTVVLGRL